MSLQLGLALPEPRRDGMEAALDHAGSEWKSEAYTFLCRYARETPSLFIGEDVSDLHIFAGKPQPQDLRAWGSLYQRAVRERVIERVDNNGYSRRRASPCPRYRSLVSA